MHAAPVAPHLHDEEHGALLDDVEMFGGIPVLDEDRVPRRVALELNGRCDRVELCCVK